MGQHHNRIGTREHASAGAYIEMLEPRQLLASPELIHSTKGVTQNPQIVFASDTRFFFDLDSALWVSEGSRATTQKVSIGDDSAVTISYPTVVNGSLYFLAQDPSAAWTSEFLLPPTKLYVVGPDSTEARELPLGLSTISGIWAEGEDLIVWGKRRNDATGLHDPVSLLRSRRDGKFREFYDGQRKGVIGSYLSFRGRPHVFADGVLYRIDERDKGNPLLRGVIQLPGAAGRELTVIGEHIYYPTVYNDTWQWFQTDTATTRMLRRDNFQDISSRLKPVSFWNEVWFLERHMFLRLDPATGIGTDGPRLPVRYSSSDVSPTALQAAGSKLFAAGTDGSVWVTDGTQAGTQHVPIFATKERAYWTQIIPAGDGRAVVRAYDREHGFEFWVTDGTREGTVVFDVYPGRSHSHATSLVIHDNEAYFFATRPGVTGLFRVDVHSVNHRPVAAIKGRLRFVEGQPLVLNGSGSSDPDGDALTYQWDLNGDGGFTDAQGSSPVLSVPWRKLRALGLDGPSVRAARLRVADNSSISTPAAVSLTVIDAPPTATASFPQPLLVGTDFAAVVQLSDPGLDQATSYTIHWGDGTTTTSPASQTSVVHRYAAPGVFAMKATIRNEDGAHGPMSVASLSVKSSLAGPVRLSTAVGARPAWNKPENPTIIEMLPNGRLVYTARDYAGRWGLWSSDGTAYGARLLIPDVVVEKLVLVGDGAIAFTRASSYYGLSVWRTDGTPGGTRWLFRRDSIELQSLFTLGNRLFFVASDEHDSIYDVLLSTDGTIGGERVVDSGGSHGWLFLRNPLVHGSDVYLTDTNSGDPGITRLFRLVGGSRLVQVATLNGDWPPVSIVSVGDWLYAHNVSTVPDSAPLMLRRGSLASPQTGMRLVSTRGSEGIRFTSAFPGPQTLLLAGGGAQDSVSWTEFPMPAQLWAVTEEGRLQQLKRFSDDSDPGQIEFISNAGGYTFFTVKYSQGLRQLWRTDGTSAGTQLVVDRQDSGAHYLAVGKLLYFTAYNRPGGIALYRTDGTARGTFALTGDFPLSSYQIVRYGDRVLFIHRENSRQPWSWWVSDGTRDGTSALPHMSVPRTNGRPFEIRVLRGRIHLLVEGENSLHSLWRIYPDQ